MGTPSGNILHIRAPEANAQSLLPRRHSAPSGYVGPKQFAGVCFGGAKHGRHISRKNRNSESNVRRGARCWCARCGSILFSVGQPIKGGEFLANDISRGRYDMTPTQPRRGHKSKDPYLTTFRMLAGQRTGAR